MQYDTNGMENSKQVNWKYVNQRIFPFYFYFISVFSLNMLQLNDNKITTQNDCAAVTYSGIINNLQALFLFAK